MGIAWLAIAQCSFICMQVSQYQIPHKKVPNVNIALLAHMHNYSLRSRCKYSIHNVHKGQMQILQGW